MKRVFGILSLWAIIGPAHAAPPSSAIQPPKLIKDVQPVYPSRAEAQGIGAVVIVQIDVDIAGNVVQVALKQPAETTGFGFDEAALEAAKKLRFLPARMDDEAIPVRIDYRFGFEPRVRPPPKSTETSSSTPVRKAGTSALHGVLKERGTRLPLVGVRLTVFRGEGEAAEGFEIETDKNGTFRFEELLEGRWRILADPSGYYPVRETVNLEAHKRTTVEYLIEVRSYNPYDVVIESARVRREISVVSIDARRAERIPGTFGDVLAVVQNFPGVARIQAGQLVIRGSAPEDSRFHLAGFDIPLLYHLGGLRSVLPANMVERINFYPGNFSVEYGRITGGLVDIDLKALRPKKIGGYLDISVFDANLYFEVPVGEKFAAAVSARRSYFDALLIGGSANANTVQPRYYDLHALASYRPSPAHHIQAFFMFSDDKQELFESAAATIPEERDATRFYRGVLRYRFVPNARLKNEFKLSFGRDIVDREVNVNLDDTDPFSRLRRYQGQLRERLSLRFGRAIAVRLGVDLLVEHIDRSVRVPAPISEGQGRLTDPDENEVTTEARPTISSEFQGSTYSAGGFFEIEIKPYRDLVFLAGLRADRWSRTGTFSLSPRLTVRHRLGSKWRLKGGVGLFVQEPTFDETDAKLGTPGLGLERAVHYSAGVEFLPVQHVTLGLTGFYKSHHDLVSPSAPKDEEDSAAPRFTNNGEGRVIGLEVWARHQLTNNFYGWLAYTLSRAERKDAGDRDRRLFDHDQTHILTAIASYKLPHNWEVGARFRLVSGNLYTPIKGSVYDTDTEVYEPIFGAVNSTRHPVFHQLDLRVDKRWIFDGWMLNAYLDIQNVYNRREESISYNFDFSEVIRTKIGLPILPILGLRGEF